MSSLHAVLIAILQGATELFPVSSLGHAVVIPRLIGWDFDQRAPSFLPFLVVLHLGTAGAMLIYFWRDWYLFVRVTLGFAPHIERTAGRRLLGLMIVATLPAAIVGFLLEKQLRHLFASPTIAACFLVFNGFILFGGERLRRTVVAQGAGAGLDRLTWKDALLIGLWQCAAFAPGISRSGVTIVAGLQRGLHHAAAAHFSFLIAVPIIFGATAFEVPLMVREDTDGITGLAIAAGMVAGITAFLSLWLLMRYFKIHEMQALDPFAYYCWALGIVALTMIGLRTLTA